MLEFQVQGSPEKLISLPKVNLIDSSMLYDYLIQCMNDSCDKESAGKVKRSIYRAPQVLTIHLNRLENDKKNDKLVKFTETLDIKRLITETETENTASVYHLNAIIVHQGASLLGGHYVAYAKASNGQWHCFDGESVREIDRTA